MSSRRTFLKQAGVVAAAGAALPGCDALLWPDLQSVAGAMVRFLNRPRLARRTGRRYLETGGAGDAASLESMAARVLDSLGMDPDKLGVVGLETLRDGLARRIREDFAAERTAIVDGWLLSRTECRLCALAYLQNEADT